MVIIMSWPVLTRPFTPLVHVMPRERINRSPESNLALNYPQFPSKQTTTRFPIIQSGYS
jgi:hypothetical protein